MPVEFLGIAATNDGSEITARSGPIFDKEYTLRLARAHEENGWDRVLFAYGSNAPDPNIGAAYIASKTEKLQLLLAHRPNVSYPTFAAYQAGGAEADIYCLWGEPLARTAEQIESVRQAAKEAGRTDTPKIQVAFRPIIAPTEAQAWEKAHDIVARIEARVQASGGALTRRRPVKNPENTGSQRLIAIAEEGERYDRALWTRTAAVTGGSGNSNALVGTPETVAQAILDYIDLGVDVISMRGYDLLQDAVDVGEQVIPIVRAEVAKRDAALAR